MGARHSKRSVDITTTPKKGEDGVAVIEGEEGKLEKIVESDLKVTTNGTLHNEIEFADKEETSKDETEDKEKVEAQLEIKENGLPEEPSNAVNECKKAEGEVENSTEQVVNGETEKTPEKVSPQQKVEETTEQKKKKEKKKKWSFRSISFSKKDKSKPSKDSGDKNGDVKEVTEENVEDKIASPTTADTPKVDEPKPAENSETATSVTNVDPTPSEEAAKPAEADAPKAKEDEPKPTEEPAIISQSEAQSVVEVKSEETKKEEPISSVLEPAAEAAPAPATLEEATKVEEPSKEVRTEEVPPPLPSSNPPSPVTVFAESTKADAALTSGQVPLEEPKEVKEVVESSVTEAVLADPHKADNSAVSEPPAIPEPIPVPELTAESLPSNLSELIAEVAQEQPTEPLLPSPEPPVLETNIAEPLPPSPPSPLPEKIDKVIPAAPLYPTKASAFEQVEVKETNPDPSPSIEDLPPAPPSPIPDPPSDPEPVIESLVESVVESKPAESIPILEPSSAAVENVAEPTPPSPLSQESTPETSSLVEEAQKTEVKNETKPPAEPISVPESPKTEEATVESSNVEPSTPPPTPAASSEMPPLEPPSNVEIPSAGSPPPVSDASEPVAPADSLPDISTESLPSLPEPLSESLAPMSLPPVESVPEPIAPTEPDSTTQKELPPAPLTNGNMNGHSSPSPVEDAVLESEVTGTTKQIPLDAAKESEISPEAGDKPTETAVATAEE